MSLPLPPLPRLGMTDLSADNEAEQHSHPYSAPHDQSNFRPKYTEREDRRQSDPDSPIDNELHPPPRTRSRPFSQGDRALEWDECPGPSRVFSMQVPAIAAHPTHHRASQSASTSVWFESSIRESEPQRNSGNGVLKRGVSAPKLKRTITEYVRIGRQKRHTWGTRTARGAGRGGSVSLVSQLSGNRYSTNSEFKVTRCRVKSASDVSLILGWPGWVTSIVISRGAQADCSTVLSPSCALISRI